MLFKQDKGMCKTEFDGSEAQSGHSHCMEFTRSSTADGFTLIAAHFSSNTSGKRSGVGSSCDGLIWRDVKN